MPFVTFRRQFSQRSFAILRDEPFPGRVPIKNVGNEIQYEHPSGLKGDVILFKAVVDYVASMPSHFEPCNKITSPQRGAFLRSLYAIVQQAPDKSLTEHVIAPPVISVLLTTFQVAKIAILDRRWLLYFGKETLV